MGPSIVYLLTPVSPLHPGAGRSPGIVDLPVVRDSMRYPIIYGSSIKGSLKTLVARRKCKNYISGGKIDCSQCKKVCCLLGSEEGAQSASSVAVEDAILLAIPVPSITHGLIYVTSPYLLARAHAILSGLGAAQTVLAEFTRDVIRKLDANKSPLAPAGSQDVAVGTVKLNEAARIIQENPSLDDELGRLSPILEVYRFSKHLVVLPEPRAWSAVESALIHLTRVRLDKATKTVLGGALWTEEYIPPGTLFLGAFVETGWTDPSCKNNNRGTDGKKPLEELWGLLKETDGRVHLIIGGKETVGKGLVAIKKLNS